HPSVQLCALYTRFLCHALATPDIYTLSLHDALPISVAGPRAVGVEAGRQVAAAGEHDVVAGRVVVGGVRQRAAQGPEAAALGQADRKSTRLNSSHQIISYAVFCLKKKTARNRETVRT